jgi:hypothetical protein
MTKGATASMALALLCAGSMQASAALPQTHSHRVVYRHRIERHLYVAHQNVAALRAAVPERPTMFPSARPLPPPYNVHETDGLSRNPNDCVVWGCVDSN